MRTKDASASELLELVAAASMEAGPNVAEEIATAIQSLIASGDLAGGIRLPSERDLATALGVSRPTVSQAIRILVTKGLVETRRGSGAHVTRRPEYAAGLFATILPVDAVSMPDLADLRLWLETMGLTRAIEHATEDDLDACAAALDELRDASKPIEWMSTDTRFHASLVRSSHNAQLASLFEGVHAALVRYEYDAWIRENSAPEWLGTDVIGEMLTVHEPLLAALRARDADAARTAVLRHHEVMAQHLATVRDAEVRRP